MAECLYDLARIKISRRCNGYYLRWYYNGWHYWLFATGKIIFTTQGEKYRTLGTQKFVVGSTQLTYEQTTAIRTITNTREIYIYTDAGWGVVRIEAATWQVFNNITNGYDIEITLVVGSRAVSSTGFSPAVQLPVIEPSIVYCELNIPAAGQIWMCRNWDVNYPGSKVYDNNEANRAVYGGLYTYAQVMTPGFIPDGWHVPTKEEWETLIAAAGGTAVGGGVLKEAGVTHWQFPNTGAVDTFGFGALPGGYYDPPSGLFLLEKQQAWYLTATERNATTIYTANMQYNNDNAVADGISNKSQYFSLRLIRTIFTGVPVALPATLAWLNGFTSNWNTLTGATGYYLTVATDAAFTNIVAGYNNLDVGNVTSFAVTGLLTGTVYYYRIRGYNALGYVSAYSNVITIPTLYGFLVSTVGAGTGVSRLNMSSSAPVTVTLSGTARFYTDVAGTLGESSSVSFVGAMAYYVRCPSGTSNLLFSDINLMNGTFIWFDTTPIANCPSLSGNNFLFPNVTNANLSGHNTISFNVNTLPAGLTDFVGAGSNTINGVVADIPANIQNFSLLGNNTLSGDLADIPATVITFRCEGGNTITGDIADCPATLTEFYCLGAATLYGLISALPASLVTFGGRSALTTIIGDISDFSAALKSFTIQGDTTGITGDLADLPANFENLLILAAGGVITGDLSDLPASFKQLRLGCTSSPITGALSSLPAGVYDLYVSSADIAITGDFADIPSSMIIFFCSGSSGISNYTSGHVFANALFYLYNTAGGAGLSTAEVDNLLIDLDASATNVKTINLTGTHGARSAASNAAVASLIGKGCSVTTN